MRRTVNDSKNKEETQALRQYVAATLGPVRSLRPVAGGGAQGAAVWRAVLASGEQAAVKRHAHAGAGEVEFGVLRMLYRLGAPVPEPLHWDPCQRTLVTAWVGKRTLAAEIQAAPPSPTGRQNGLPSVAHALIKGSTALETAFQGLAARLPRQQQTDERRRREAEARARCRQAPETFAQLAAFCGVTPPSGWEPALHDAWAELAQALTAGRLTFGGRDCTPRNVLTDGSAVWFVDFAVVGLDWPEARLAQYAAAASLSDPAQAPQSLLTHAKPQWYGENGYIESAHLDMQHLLLWSQALRLMLQGQTGPPERRRAPMRRKLDQALALALFPLACGSPAERVRSLIAAVFGRASLTAAM